MTPDEAEAILALADEVAVGVELAADEAAFRSDWRIRYGLPAVRERLGADSLEAKELIGRLLAEQAAGSDD